jgi:hypothetical protein
MHAAAGARIRRAQTRVGLEGRWPFDSASASGGLYIEDESGDALADDARLALTTLLKPRPGLRYPTGVEVREALWGGGDGADRAPSIVWHAQAIGVLLEVGYLPSAECVQTHLRVLKERLHPKSANDPADPRADQRWPLRTRHVAWVLACLAELSAHAVPRGDVPDRIRQALAEWETVLGTAFTYLVGNEGPAAWVGIQPGERFWSEYWGRRRINLLNTIYASLAICRASRHGFRIPRENSWDGSFSVEHTIHAFVDEIRVEPTPQGPRTRLGGVWHEPWVRGPLPAGVVGLLGLLLHEYAHLLLGLARPGSALEMRARRAFTLARRIAHDLLSRDGEWVGTIDAFSYQGAERRWWYVPSYSVCVRAILESGAVGPHHAAVVSAMEAITRFHRRERAQNGDEYETWADPTRTDLAARIPDEAFDEAWHAVVDVTAVPIKECPASASSIHASVMAHAAFRRSVHAVDPRVLEAVMRGERDYGEEGRPQAPFSSVVISHAPSHDAPGRPRDFELALCAGDYYEERYRVVAGTAALLVACDRIETPATDTAIGRKVHALGPEDLSLPRSPEGVRKAIGRINTALGVDLVQRSGAQPVRSSISTRVLINEETLDARWLSRLSKSSCEPAPLPEALRRSIRRDRRSWEPEDEKPAPNEPPAKHVSPNDPSG